MSSKRNEYKVDARTKMTALFFLAYEPNPVMRLSIPEAMRAKGYTNVEAVDQILVQQVRCKSQKNKSNDIPHPESVAALSLLALATVATAASSRPVLQTITPNPTAAPSVAVGGINAGILPSLERKVRKTSHREQIGKQNKRKRKVVHAQAHAPTTTLVAKERALPKEVCGSTIQVIAQVKGGFRVWAMVGPLTKILSIDTFNSAWLERFLLPVDMRVRCQVMPLTCLCLRLSNDSDKQHQQYRD
jgi:hypothetical protein